MNTLISVTELSALLEDSVTLIFDCRFSLLDFNEGLKSYQEKHIPGARYVDLNKDLSAEHIPNKTGRHPLPTKMHWIQQVQNWGINPDTQVVVYDDATGAGASRLWWMLRWIGHENVAVLDGGIQAWKKAGYELSNVDSHTSFIKGQASAFSKGQASAFDYSTLPALTLTIEANELDGESQCLIDARALPRFLGQVEPVDVVAGHIPGAICSPYTDNLTQAGFFKSPELLREKFSEAGGISKPMVCYCGSGVTAAHNILAIKLAGFDEAALYAGSWSEWITDTTRAVATVA